MKRAFRNLPLRSKIALFTSIMLGISLLTLTLITTAQERRSSQEELADQAGIILNTLPYSIRDELYFVKVDELKDVAKEVGKSESIECFVIYDRNGVVLADSTKISNVSSELSLDMPDDPDPLGVALISQAPGNDHQDWDSEPDKFTAGRAIYLNGEIIGAVSVTMSTDVMKQKIDRIIFQSGMLTLLIIGAGVSLSFIFARQISNPLRDLMKIAREMAGGSTELRVNMHAKDEIGQLGLAFNDMMEAIQTRERALREITASLEQKVEERTEELRQRNNELVKMATSDPLTRINNRRHFFDLAGNEYERAKRYKHPLSLIIADADYFKNVNDTYGHQVGDELLIKLANFFQENVRSVDIVARYGGEEFIILMPQINCKEAAQTAERLRQQIAQMPLAKSHYQIMLTVSLGVACWNAQKELDFETLIYRADKALYQSKHDGRNRVTVWEEENSE